MNKDFLVAYDKLLSSIDSIKKKSDNPYYSSKYADLNAIFDEVKDKIRANGFILLQNVEKDILRTRIIHIETGEMLESEFELITAKPDMQQRGSAVTYARRYSLLPMLNIETEDDDGNLASGIERKKYSDDFKKDAIKEKTATTKAINKAVKDGTEYVKPASEKSLEDRYKSAKAFLDKQDIGTFKTVGKSVIDSLNNLISDLDKKGCAGWRDELKTRYERLVNLDDKIKYWGEKWLKKT